MGTNLRSVETRQINAKKYKKEDTDDPNLYYYLFGIETADINSIPLIQNADDYFAIVCSMTQRTKEHTLTSKNILYERTRKPFTFLRYDLTCSDRSKKAGIMVLYDNEVYPFEFDPNTFEELVHEIERSVLNIRLKTE